MCYIPTLKNLSGLRELVFTPSSLLSREASLISTITSKNSRKILFTVFDPRNLRRQLWLPLDTTLSSLVDHLRVSGYQHVLDLELRSCLYVAKTVSEAGPDGFLPRFREKGRVIISEIEMGKILYCSDGSLESVLDLQDSKSETARMVPTSMVPQGFFVIT